MWNRPTDELPDDDITVLAIFAGDIEPEKVYHDGDRWVLCATGGTMDGEPIWWAHLPNGPAQPSRRTSKPAQK